MAMTQRVATGREQERQRSGMGLMRIQRAPAGEGWELWHEDAGYLMPLTYQQMLAVIRNEFDVSGLLRGELVKVEDRQ